MNTLLIILIIVLIAQSLISIYIDIINKLDNKQLYELQTIMRNNQQEYLNEKTRFNDKINERDTFILQQAKTIEELKKQLKEKENNE